MKQELSSTLASWRRSAPSRTQRSSGFGRKFDDMPDEPACRRRAPGRGDGCGPLPDEAVQPAGPAAAPRESEVVRLITFAVGDRSERVGSLRAGGVIEELEAGDMLEWLAGSGRGATGATHELA